MSDATATPTDEADADADAELDETLIEENVGVPETDEPERTKWNVLIGLGVWLSGAGAAVAGIHLGYAVFILVGGIVMMGGAILYETPLHDDDRFPD